ncbi:MAG: multidrug transporter [Ignavibacteria bacterium RIFOXYB2_FULL_35_12]|nr:MAG: multidrug transporter [Ignavibacteria bacterium GWA2_36_19]OGU58875.1 MAG: multidrug transporter [Ignavibacteria bacterium GWF2_35_20]OGU77985.1 MAG: multidrug transporter [Ignavibacteria bacterium RIFOXYA2_FULL_35_9]OGU84436.1 MAG: multidrug transporter [Ignavibacteria bacterium RBG_16_35_7]OGU86009.1 MAG: multidrug transporter [Ignavibacteria bacterium RIFOXYA12_FULL_35_25]OGU91033.1 MAG: multidrug transporter [Ignavibacteria bacterium RIFOXYC12_FULL_35_11]OGU97133.1 MAG: multidrug 
MEKNNHEDIVKTVDTLSSVINKGVNELAIILAAGHGKRIKSHRSKMLHKIWEVPTVERVYNACANSIKGINIIVVVGIKAKYVMEVIGKRKSTLFAYQESQNGTGHAVQVALDRIDEKFSDGIVYILPGDMGLIDEETILTIKNKFIEAGSDMLVLTGLFEGDIKNNSYGRIIRVKEKDADGKSSGNDAGKVIEIMEAKDIEALPEGKPYRVVYNKKTYEYSKQEIRENREFNSGVYAFKYKKLTELINSLSSNNVQNEIYITDLISLFNKKNYSVTVTSPHSPYVVMGFNNKSVLKEMEDVARRKVYEKLKDIIEIDDPEDFFIHEEIVDEIIEIDKKNIPLDIKIGKGVYIGKGVKLNYNLEFKKNVFVDGNIQFGQNVVVWQNVHLSTLTDQTLKIGDNVEILWGDIIKGNIEIGDDSRIESSVNMTGSDDYPIRIGKKVLIKGTSYVFGSIIEDEVYIEHSVLIKKRVERLMKKDGTVLPIRFYLPMPEGIDAIDDL